MPIADEIALWKKGFVEGYRAGYESAFTEKSCEQLKEEAIESLGEGAELYSPCEQTIKGMCNVCKDSSTPGICKTYLELQKEGVITNG